MHGIALLGGIRVLGLPPALGAALGIGFSAIAAVGLHRATVGRTR